jgi:hypothetical protein
MAKSLGNEVTAALHSDFKVLQEATGLYAKACHKELPC